MTTSSVREVKLRLRIPESEAESARTLRTLAEQTFLRGVLDALEDAVHARLGPRAIVRIKRLPLRWKLGSSELPDRAVHARLGAELAEALLADAALPAVGAAGTGERTARTHARPSPTATIAVFADDAHALAVALAERAEGRPAAFHHPATSIAELWQLVIAGGDDQIASVLALLAAYEIVIADLEPPAEIRGAIAVQRVRAPARSATRLVAERARRRDPLAPPPPTESAPEARTSMPIARAATAASAIDGAAEVASRATGETAPAVASASSSARAQAAPSFEHDADAIASSSPIDASEAIATRVGGVFFLLARVAELELGEHLWCAGIAEGPAIARALALFVPPALRDDPAFAVIAGGAPPEVAQPPVWATTEVIDKTHRALGRWLAKRGATGDVVRRCEELAKTLDAEPVYATMAAAIAAVVCERLGLAWSTAPTSALAIHDGAIRAENDEILVELAARELDVDVRRAGLDFDPGWVPWLERRVRIRYAAEVW